MSLADIIIEERTSSLYQKYPEVKLWMYRELRNMFVVDDRNEVSVHVKTKSLLRWNWNDQLPITDSNGLVDMDDLLDMLRAEGFGAYYESPYMLPEYVNLIIKLK